jgi:Type I phosphodiesterase / nucleotide pyrophosphatase
MRWRLTVLGLVLALGLATLTSTARVSRSGGPAAPVALEQRGPGEQVVLVFIDSLSREIATNAQRMPTLARLAREGASFDVEPCRDQLTYLCVRAALTGHDDSSLLAISDNFRPSHEGPPHSLLSALAETKRRSVVIGSTDFHPYRRALFGEHGLSKHDETPAHVLAALAEVQRSKVELIVLSLSSGDMAAHAHGVTSPDYDAAFSRLDQVVGAVADSLPPRTSLVVFGDHGHDENGRHLPGTASKTWAVYRGPAFRAGAKSALVITDHRALLGVLLGVPTELLYRGPPLDSLFEPRWLASHFHAPLPALTAMPEVAGALPAARWLLVLGMCGAASSAVWLLSRSRALLLLALGACGGAVALGLGFDRARTLLHDHGDSPERALLLLLPLALACAVALALQRARPFTGCADEPSWLRAAAASTLLSTLLLLLPTAYYYGARRAIVLASSLAIAAMLVDYFRRPAPAAARWWPAFSLLFTVAALASLYQVRQLGPETAGAAAWALDAAVYVRSAWLPLLLSKVVLGAVLLAPRASTRRLDRALAAGLLLVCLLVELGGLRLPRTAYGALFVALLARALCARHLAPSSSFAGALLLLEHLYGGNAAQIAPIQVILAATAAASFAWRRMQLPPLASRLASALTVTVGLYLMLWPTVGFHLVGIDFAYMFQWVNAESYEKTWWVIGLGVILKLSLPLVLVLAVAREELRGTSQARVVSATLAAKVATLSIMIASYAVHHDMSSQQALAMLAELILVMFVVCSCAFAFPVRASVRGSRSKVVAALLLEPRAASS